MPIPASSFLWRQALAAGRLRLAAAAGFAALSALVGIPLAFALGKLIAAALEQQPLSPVLLALVLGLVALRALLAYEGETSAAQVSASVRVHLRHRLFGNRLEHGPLAALRQETGTLATALVERIEALDGYIARYMPQIVVAGITLPAIFITLLFISPFVAMVLLVSALLTPVLMALVGMAAAHASRRQFAQLGKLGGAFHDRLKNLELLRLFGAAEREGKKLEETAQAFRQRTMAVLRLAFLSSASLELVVSVAFVLAALHLRLVNLSRSDAFFVLLLLPEFFAPLRAVLAGYHDRANALAAAEGLLPLLMPAPCTTGGFYRFETLPLMPSIGFHAVSFTYPDRSLPSVSDVSFSVQEGECVALCGPSGAGKSTILSLLLGFARPNAGHILVAGQPLEAIDHAQRAALFSWVGQRSHIFFGTLRDNIRFGRYTASDDEIRAAANRAGLADLIQRLPQGLETVVGERGFGLSGGEARRVALARAFLRNAPVLLLDEPTAGLDSITAAGLLDSLRELARGKTTLIATHDDAVVNLATYTITLGTRKEAA